MMGNQESSGLSRRGLLRAGALLTAVMAVPGRVWAAMTRPDGAFKAEGIDAAMASIASSATVSDQIDLETPDIAENGGTVPVVVNSKLPGTTRVAILVELNPNPLSAIFVVPEGSDAYIETRVKVAQTCNIYALVEAGGQWYQASKETKVTLGGCGG